MSGGNNATIAIPGPNWSLEWPFTFDDLQLDIVGFLAVLGEGSVLANAQVSALSRLFYLPRLIPAPQALLWPNRPIDLPPTTAKVTAVYSGNVKDQVHHVASVLLHHEMPAFMVRCVEVRKKLLRHAPTLTDTFLRGQPARAKTQSPVLRPAPVKAKATGPLSWVTMLGFFLSLSLFIISLALGDGMSMVATLLLSFLSTLIGLGNKWSLKLPQRRKDNNPPPGDVVIRYPNGSHLVVRCDEDVARELYFAPEEIEYNIKSAAAYRMISLVGTITLMLGVIALANSKLQLQICWAIAYIVINAAHWIAAALPARLHWDLSCYEITEQGMEGGPKNPSFTEALWKAIVLTKSTRWIKNGKAAPQTQVWDEWLLEAEEHAKQAGSCPGYLERPLWPGDRPDTATIWCLPPGWDPKKAWDRLNEQVNLAAEKNSLHPVHAV